jgi:signal transduction histidine kinase/ActR/RegA family two-component response regulator
VKTLDWAKLLQCHPIFSRLDDEHREWLLSEEVSTERSYEAGALIFQDGEIGDSIFLIGSGSVEAVLSAESGETIPLSVMREGDSFGEMAFFEGKPRSAAVRVREASIVLEIKAREARRLVDEHPDVGIRVLLKASERLRNKNEQILALVGAERHARAEAEDANRAKDQFLAMLGHELRNPLGAISAAVEVLDRLGEPHDQTARFRGIIIRQMQHLSRLVDDLLDVSRIVSGTIALNREAVDLRGVAVRTLSSFHEAGKTTEHVIALTGDPIRVNGDPTRLQQVISNLLDNAVKYTPSGGRIELTLIADGTDAVFRVRDTGVGIHPDMLPRVFDPFVQAGDSRGRSTRGLGLGLALVRRLVELHGGTVSGSSPGPNQGSEFVVRLPRISDATAIPQPAGGKRLPDRARHIVIIEDNQDFRSGLGRLMELWGHRVEEAANGARGLALVHASRPEIVLVDLGLPDLDGYAVARSIRSAPGGDVITLVAITGYGRPEDRRQAKEAGFDAHLTKPVNPDELTEILSRGADAEGAAH